VNGLLPCGLVYAAAVAAAGLGGVWTGLVFMAGFGAGTIPVLLMVTISASSLPASSRARLSRLAPLALAVTGMLLIGRGVLPVHHVASVHAQFNGHGH
jgi:sulfite exporter TauE/SafE